MISVAGIGCYCGKLGPHNHYEGDFMSDPTQNFNSTDPQHVLIAITAIAQLVVALAPTIAQIIAAFNTPKQG